ncbi:ribosome recycling factor [Striga asiatica]|uniref:Ribosome recycling factor n=1 Tax=Striga asiatica TaxID=4170 RepID=A0A5A7QCQ0_STRAF|nr:ribosome recycling factor [Striga asiatica]
MGLLLKLWAHRLWPNDNAKTTQRARMKVNLRVTAMARLARSGSPAPNSFDTLVLKIVNQLVETSEFGINPASKTRISKAQYSRLVRQMTTWKKHNFIKP